ncbi:MAG: hypothetical protein H0U27_03240 [Nitrosopumilus sp.]|nr:hypothetical protein [Nitrosopumilus sp.]
MNNECVAGFDDLLRKSYNELGIHSVDSSLNYADMVTLANSFSTYFKDVTLSSPCVIVLKTIAYSLQSNGVVLSKDKLYDFFIESYKFLITNTGEIKGNPASIRSGIIDNSFFEICNDLLISYDLYDEKIKIQIPNLIVDVNAALFFKTDPYGKKISTFQIKPYYISKKESLVSNLPDNVSSIKDLNAKSHNSQKKDIEPQKIKKPDSDSDAVVVLDEAESIDDGVIPGISRITRRDCHSIRQSLTMLPDKEIRKLHDLCNNYDKIIRYGKLDSPKEFKLAVELGLKRPLSDKQARHSQACIKKVHYYIESMLDRKFEPHLTHGINHVKHNFEYGYSLAGLIGNSRSRNEPK